MLSIAVLTPHTRALLLCVTAPYFPSDEARSLAGSALTQWKSAVPSEGNPFDPLRLPSAPTAYVDADKDSRTVVYGVGTQRVFLAAIGDATVLPTTCRTAALNAMGCMMTRCRGDPTESRIKANYGELVFAFRRVMHGVHKLAFVEDRVSSSRLIDDSLPDADLSLQREEWAVTLRRIMQEATIGENLESFHVTLPRSAHPVNHFDSKVTVPLVDGFSPESAHVDRVRTMLRGSGISTRAPEVPTDDPKGVRGASSKTSGARHSEVDPIAFGNEFDPGFGDHGAGESKSVDAVRKPLLTASITEVLEAKMHAGTIELARVIGTLSGSLVTPEASAEVRLRLSSRLDVARVVGGAAHAASKHLDVRWPVSAPSLTSGPQKPVMTYRGTLDTIPVEATSKAKRFPDRFAVETTIRVLAAPSEPLSGVQARVILPVQENLIRSSKSLSGMSLAHKSLSSTTSQLIWTLDASMKPNSVVKLRAIVQLTSPPDGTPPSVLALETRLRAGLATTSLMGMTVAANVPHSVGTSSVLKVIYRV